jgi:site-specific DNA-methyltransferase (adenine-specific)
MSLNNILIGDCQKIIPKIESGIDLTFLDPPFNQKKDYRFFNDDLSETDYWNMMTDISSKIYDKTNIGGSIYFMQREKNTENVLKCLRQSGWNLQNLIIWKKKTSAVPCSNRYGKHYQIIAYSIKGKKAKIFNKLRIDPELPANYKQGYTNGVFVTDVWDDIRELTSGYFAGDEAIRSDNGERFHKQQSPIALLLRIILSSTLPNDVVFDPFSGTGTTVVTAKQLGRKYLGIEIDPENAKCIEERLSILRDSDDIRKFLKYYRHTEKLEEIWGLGKNTLSFVRKEEVNTLFNN